MLMTSSPEYTLPGRPMANVNESSKATCGLSRTTKMQRRTKFRRTQTSTSVSPNRPRLDRSTCVAVVHAFTTGAMVQVFSLTQELESYSVTGRDTNKRADHDGFHSAPQNDSRTEAGIDLLFTKPVDPSVVETLLLLECVRVNRQTLQARNR